MMRVNRQIIDHLTKIDMTKSENANLVLGREEVYRASPRIWPFKYTNDIVNGMNLNLSNMVAPIPLSVEATRGKIRPLEVRRFNVETTFEIERGYMEDKIDSHEYFRSNKAVKHALKMIEVDGRDHYERMIREHKLTNIAYDYVTL